MFVAAPVYSPDMLRNAEKEKCEAKVRHSAPERRDRLEYLPGLFFE